MTPLQTVLIVDDQATNLKLLRAQLEAEQYRVLTATEGVEALVVLEREKVDAIISDILMPQMDGYSLCNEVRKRETLRALPFIFYTATYVSPSDETLCFELGGDIYLRKPATVAEIVGALRGATTAATRRSPTLAGSLSEIDVMKKYSQRLVSKLEEKCIELHQALGEAYLAHDKFIELNKTLEQRVAKRTSELKVANKELGAFSYSVSHDLRAPLRAIDGYSQIVLEDYSELLPEEGKEHLRAIRKGTQRMGQLIDDLLRFSRLGQSAMTMHSVDMDDLVRNSLYELEGSSNKLMDAITIEELPRCLGDLALLKQVWMNLVANALKFTSKRATAQIVIGATHSNSEIVYFVRDNGTGFDMKYYDNLFGVFQRLHRSDEYEGTGVGLAIVKRVVDRHGGRVWAEGELNKGATFYFALKGDVPDTDLVSTNADLRIAVPQHGPSPSTH